MKSTNDDIEEPVKKSWTVLVIALLVLAFMLGIGIFLLVEALQKPVNAGDVLDMNRMLVSGVGVILFSLAIIVFLYSLYKPGKKRRKPSAASGKKPGKRKKRKSR